MCRMNLTTISSFGVKVTTLAITVAIWVWSKKVTDPKRLLGKVLEKNGFVAPLFASIDEEDWRIGYGEATKDGGRVSFFTALSDDGMVIVVTSPKSQQKRITVAIWSDITDRRHKPLSVFFFNNLLKTNLPKRRLKLRLCLRSNLLLNLVYLFIGECTLGWTINNAKGVAHLVLTKLFFVFIFV